MFVLCYNYRCLAKWKRKYEEEKRSSPKSVSVLELSTVHLGVLSRKLEKFHFARYCSFSFSVMPKKAGSLSISFIFLSFVTVTVTAKFFCASVTVALFAVIHCG